MDNISAPSSNATPLSPPSINPPPPPTESSSPQKKRPSKFFIIFLIATLLIGVGVGGYLVQQQILKQRAHTTGWVHLAGPAGHPEWAYNCFNCDEGGFKGAINPKQRNQKGDGHYPDNGTTRYKCAYKPGTTPNSHSDYWFANGCQTGAPGLTSKQNTGKVDYNFCGMQQIDRGGTFYSYWDVRRETCKEEAPPLKCDRVTIRGSNKVSTPGEERDIVGQSTGGEKPIKWSWEQTTSGGARGTLKGRADKDNEIIWVAPNQLTPGQTWTIRGTVKDAKGKTDTAPACAETITVQAQACPVPGAVTNVRVTCPTCQ